MSPARPLFAEMGGYAPKVGPTEDSMLGISTFAKQFFGSANERKIKPLWAVVTKINALEPRFQAMSDDELKAMTPAFRERLAAGETAGRSVARGFRGGARGGQAHLGPAPFRRPAGGRHGAA